jgi:F-type H+-transporting ATPase subunit gamma
MDDYLAGTIDRVYVSYPELVSTANQRPTIRQLLPIEPPQMDDTADGEAFRQDYIFEPSPDVVLQRLLPRYIEMQIYEAVLQTAASFQSAQMVAMKNATDNAQDITRELTLTYNKIRQEQITKELLDIVGGAAALED